MPNASNRKAQNASHPIYIAYELWLQQVYAKGCSPKTLSTYRELVEPFVLHLCRHAPDMDSVTPLHVMEYLHQRRARGLSSHTVHSDYQKARVFWNWCLRMELTTNNPFAKVPTPKREQVLKPALTPEQVEALLRACEGKEWHRLRDRALILLLLDTGLRIHEALNLRVCDVIQETLLVKGKGGKHRLVPLSAEVRLALQRYLKACPFKPKSEQPLWYGEYGALTLEGIEVVVRKIGKRAGLRLGAHQLRRTFATWSLRSGIDLHRLQMLMGHSDLRTTQQYLALLEEDLKQAHEQHSPLNLLRTGRRSQTG